MSDAVSEGSNLQTPRPSLKKASVLGTRRIFQCVCGKEVSVPDTPNARLTCDCCGRNVTPEMQQQSMASFGATVIGTESLANDGSHGLSSGDKLDHFTVLDLLGAGGMGAVYRARDESLQRFVAIKVIAGREGEGGRVRCERLIQEARAQARVSHPNVVHIYYVGSHEDCPFFAMEYVPGQPLAKLLSAQRLPFQEIVRIGLQATEALRHSASLGVIHGDVKPGNLLLGDNGGVKLSDFGLASVTEKGNAGHSGPAGTLNYMAPEVAAGQPADVRSDMYSLGVMLYEMTFGELPLATSSESLEESIRLRQQVTVKFPSVWPSDRPAAWKTLLERLVHRDPQQRFASFAEVLTELSALQPLTLRRAGRVSRLVAWGLDMLVAGGLLGVGLGLAGVVIEYAGASQRAINVLMPFVMFTFGTVLWLICKRLQTSVGKKLLQLRIVDEFGLAPRTWKLSLSLLDTYQFYVLGAVDALVQLIFTLFGLSGDLKSMLIGKLFLVAVIVYFVISGVWMLFSRRQQRLTDRLLGLFVVLDAGKTKGI